jgi:catechol 2,3-dioxygenase-like lactoylglutathione lyase family enzyme
MTWRLKKRVPPRFRGKRVLAEASIIGFVPVSDTQSAEEFFAGKLGLRVVERGPFALVVANASGQTIRCVPVPGVTPQPFTILGWEVPEIHSAVAHLRAAGIEPILYPHFEQDAEGIWASPDGSAQVIWFNDPFGNVLSLTQHRGKASAQ